MKKWWGRGEKGCKSKRGLGDRIERCWSGREGGRERKIDCMRGRKGRGYKRD